MATAQLAPALAPFPASRPGLLRIPAPDAHNIQTRFALISSRDMFNPAKWRSEPLAPCPNFPGWWEVDMDVFNLASGVYEREYVVDGVATPDPFTEEVTRFGGYRAVMRVEKGVVVRPSFNWTGEMPAGVQLANNNKIVLYEMPLRWMACERGDERDRQVGLATFELVLFQRLAQVADLGVNAIELLPVQDSPDTLNWGYGTRFFQAPDWDMGGPVDLKFFIKSCHQRGIRVLLDVVMNHASPECPLVSVAKDKYFIDQQEGRNAWGGKLFRYDDRTEAREFHCAMAEYWVREYHIDGFRIDEFKSIKNWDFIKAFRDRAWAEHTKLFPDRPFSVIAEDSDRQFAATSTGVVDAIWNFAFRDDARRLLTNQVKTNWGQPSRSDRIRMLIGGGAIWDEYCGSVRQGYGDMAQSVNYLVSHDVKDACRMMNEIFGALLWLRQLIPPGINTDNDQDRLVIAVRKVLKNIAQQSPEVQAAHAEALDRCRSAFALLLTSVGIPMFLAGEEFGDVHDLFFNKDTKMSDPVDWGRLGVPGHTNLRDSVRSLIQLRTSHAALQRNEVDHFYFHPEMDNNDGVRVFAYCRTGGMPLGSVGQVCTLANLGPHNFQSFRFPWPWALQAPTEVAPPHNASALYVDGPNQTLSLSLAPFQIRVLTT